MKFLEFIQGKRTYVLGLAGAIINLLQVFGLVTWTAQQLLAVDGVILSLMGLTQRAATARVQDSVDNP